MIARRGGTPLPLPGCGLIDFPPALLVQSVIKNKKRQGDAGGPQAQAAEWTAFARTAWSMLRLLARSLGRSLAAVVLRFAFGGAS
jgi:hypothetical protein